MLRSLSWFLTLLILSSLVFLSDSSVYPHCSHDLKYDYLSAVSPIFYFHHRPFSVLLIHPPLEPLPLPQVPSFPWSSRPSRWPHCLSDNLLPPLVHPIPYPVSSTSQVHLEHAQSLVTIAPTLVLATIASFLDG